MRVALLCIVLAGLAFAQRFEDVPPDHWALESVEGLAELGIITGFPDGTFQGSQSLTRYQAATVFYRFLRTVSGADGVGVQRDLEALMVELELLRGDLLERLEGDEAFTLKLLNETLEQQEALQGRIDVIERDAPGAIALFDELRRNLYQLEEGFNRGLLTTKEDVLTELDLRLDGFRQALEETFVRYVEGQLGSYRAEVDGRLAQLGADVEATRAEIGRLDKERLQLEGRLLKELRDLEAAVDAERAAPPELGASVRVGGGLVGSSPTYSVALETFRGPATVVGRLDTGEIDLSGTYNLGAVEVGGGYLSSPRGAQGFVQVSTAALAPLYLSADVAHSEEIELGARLTHDGAAPNAVVRGLDFGVAGRLRVESGESLLDAHLRFALPLGALTVRPGALYRRVEGGYQGFLGSLELSYRPQPESELRLFAEGRYGIFSPLGEGEGRSAPEVSLGVDYKGVTVRGLLETGLVDFETYPTFLDAAPLEQTGLNLGLEVSAVVRFP